MIPTIVTGNQTLISLLETLKLTELEMNNSLERSIINTTDNNLINFYKSVYETKSKIFINIFEAYLDLLVEIEKKDL